MTNTKLKKGNPRQKNYEQPVNMFPNGRIDLTNLTYGECIYKMSEKAIKDLLKNRKGNERKMHPQKFLCNYVNTHEGLMYHCVKVVAM